MQGLAEDARGDLFATLIVRLGQFGAGLYKLGGIQTLAESHDLEMHMGAGTASAGAEQSDGVTARHPLPDGDIILLIVGITGYITVTMIDLDDDALPVTAAGEYYDSRGHRANLLAPGSGNINTVVKTPGAVEGILPPTERR